MEAEQKRAAEEDRRIAEERRQAEERRRKDAVAIYRNAPQSAQSALNAVKKLEARVEVGVNYADYSRAVGEAWGDVKIFIESADGKSVPEFSLLLTKAIEDYKLASDIWQNKIQWPSLYGDRLDVETHQQACWTRAGTWIKLAESLLDVEKTESDLKAFAAAIKNEEDFDAAWKKIKDENSSPRIVASGIAQYAGSETWGQSAV